MVLCQVVLVWCRYSILILLLLHCPVVSWLFWTNCSGGDTDLKMSVGGDTIFLRAYKLAVFSHLFARWRWCSGITISSYLFATWHLFRHVGYLRHQQQVGTFDIESGVRFTCDVGYLCANFSVPMPLCSRFRPDVRDRHRRQSSDKSIA